MERALRKHFQISNGRVQKFDRKASGHHRIEGKATKRRDGDTILKDFVEGNGEIIDKEVLFRFRNGDRQAITEALNQIHWRSLKKTHHIEGTQKGMSNVGAHNWVLTTNRSFAEVVKSKEDGETLEEGNEWTLVQKRSKEKKSPVREVSTIFMVNIPIEISARALWSFFKECGKIIDIILPRKRDKNGKRIGFIKTISELEAGVIICNAKEKGGLVGKIALSINNATNRVEKQSTHERNEKNLEKESLKTTSSKKKEVGKSEGGAEDQNDFGKRMFEYIEAETDEDVEIGLYQRLTWLDETPEALQDKLSVLGYDFIKVVGLSDRKFILRNEASPEWKDFVFKNLSIWFTVIRKFKEEDLIVPRTVWVECTGLPMTAWLEENLKAFSARFGEWVSWSYQKDDSNTLFNPLICIQSCEMERIEDEMIVLVKGKKYKIKFKEIDNLDNSQDKMKPMQEKDMSNIWPKETNERFDDTHKEPRVASTEVNGVAMVNDIVSQGKAHNEVNKDVKTLEGTDLLFSEVPEISFQQSQIVRNETENTENLCHKEKQKESNTVEVIENTIRDVELQESIETNDTNLLGISEDVESDGTLLSQQRSSQGSLCLNIGKLNMGAKRGRPRKKARLTKNPFDLGSNIRRLGGGIIKKRSTLNQLGNKEKSKESCKKVLCVIPQEKSQHEAEQILECAKSLGLEMLMGVEETNKIIGEKINKGVL
ncbi:hypothetical protein POM88_002877 [Heracleum sosnowskyi]|uniref:RRM domain-containing protein n=1 Tax=Heracleum sosnowskyi TaxID=360622 RepID=A0AAD8JIR8_9APIA|nr:hypothetical protein POM88_002877 [Heracleum sosnowskyi]